ncbi:MAG: thioesterase family protein [Acidimicrobiales bacterium]|nr:thioesterase family protein [Acidimicrobiales bacterium]
MSFDEATAVEQVGDTRFAARVHDGWSIAGNANGGYLLAIAARAMRDASGRPDPVSVTAHYLRPGRPGPATVDVEPVKTGKAFSVVRATLSSAEEPLLSLLGTFGTLADSEASAPMLVDARPPDLPPVEDCVRMPATADFPPPFMAKVDLRLHPDDAAFMLGERSGLARMRGWFAFPDGEGAGTHVDTIGLLQAADAFPPTIFNTELPVAWTPTVELTAHVRAVPTQGPLRCAFTTHFVTGGFLEADGEIWDGTGRLVGQSRQLALVPRT